MKGPSQKQLVWLLLSVTTALIVACAPTAGREPATSTSASTTAEANTSTTAEAGTPPAVPSGASSPAGEASSPTEETIIQEAAPTDTAVPLPNEPEPTEPGSLEGAAAAEQTTPVVSESTTRIDATIMTEDDRYDFLRELTKRWNTNWNKHTVRYEEILAGQVRDGIPSIDEPKSVSQIEAAEWLADNEPVIAVAFNGDARAYPLQILTRHEIVNDMVGGRPIVVTFCPLCNSAIVFDPTVEDEVFEFGTSGLLRNSDLIMYDRTTETLWQQFTGEAIVGDLTGYRLTFLPSSIVSFADFKAAYPTGVVLSRDTGFDRDYGSNPYVGYDDLERQPHLFTGIPDDRLPAMLRVVSVSLDAVDVAYPLPVLLEMGVINDSQGQHDLVVFHSRGTSSALGSRAIAGGADVGATGVFDPNLNGQKLLFSKVGADIIDEQTGSTWNILGQAIDGPLAGRQLTPIVHGDHFWFSWAAFRPDTLIFGER